MNIMLLDVVGMWSVKVVGMCAMLLGCSHTICVDN